jgi:hypothetical protein
MDNINLAEWYSSTQAAAIISKNSNKVVSTDYLRKLAEYGKIKKLRISDRANLYWKADVDQYRVEERGAKSARAKKAKAKERKEA